MRNTSPLCEDFPQQHDQAIQPVTQSVQTAIEARHLPPSEVVLLVRGVLKGESAATLARELGRSKTIITELRHLIQSQASTLQSKTPLVGQVVEADEMFQNAGEKAASTSTRSTHRVAAPIYEFHVNLKAISPIFIAALVRNHSFCTWAMFFPMWLADRA